MEKRRVDKKRVIRNIALIAGIALGILMLLYVAYIVKSESPEIVPTSELSGRTYANKTGEIQLVFEKDGKTTLKAGNGKEVFKSYEYRDGILVLKAETPEVKYTFLLLTKDRIFYDNESEVLYLVWSE